jgi:hypothetical protein
MTSTGTSGQARRIFFVKGKESASLAIKIFSGKEILGAGPDIQASPKLLFVIASDRRERGNPTRRAVSELLEESVVNADAATQRRGMRSLRRYAPRDFP